MINTQKSKEKYGQKLAATINHSPIPVIVELPDGEEISIKNAYSIIGRTACVKILANDSTLSLLREENDSLKHDLKTYEKENKELEEALNKQSDYDELKGADDDLRSAEFALETFEHQTNIKTKARSVEARILELMDHVLNLQDQAKELDVDNRAMAWNIKQQEEKQ